MSLFRPARRSAPMLACGALLLLTLSGGCARQRVNQGYLADETLTQTVRVGVDNRDSVEKTLGRPSFTGQFDDRDWYYVSRQTRQLAFATPRPVGQTILHVRFDPAGNVASVERRGLEQVASISPHGDKTPTLGRETSFFEDIFGNIGTVGAPGAGPGGGSNDQTRP